MSECNEHSFEIRRTELVKEKENSDGEGLSLELIESTCLLGYPMNRNNVLDGNNLVYLNGAYIAFVQNV